MNIPVTTILVRASKYFWQIQCIHTNLLNSVKMAFDITKMCCFPLNCCTGQVLWEQSSSTAHFSFKCLSAWAWRLSALHAVHKNPHQLKDKVCLRIYNRETQSGTTGLPQWEARAVSRFSAWLWKQHPGGHRSGITQKSDWNAALH